MRDGYSYEEAPGGGFIGRPVEHWIKGKQSDPYQRPRIDWLATWKQFAPFWVAVGFIVAIVYAFWR